MLKQSLISCIGSEYAQPIIDLYEKMLSFTYSGESKIKVSPRENGYAVSIIILTVLMIESALNRIKYIKKNKEKDNLIFFKKFFKNSDLLNKLTEVYIVRDSIAHNHIWEFTINYNNEFEEKIIKKELVGGYGDKKYSLCVNKEKIITSKLKINVNPMKIGILDANKIFEFLYIFLKYLESKNYSYFPALDNELVKYKDKIINFKYFLEDIIGTKITSPNSGLPIYKVNN